MGSFVNQALMIICSFMSFYGIPTSASVKELRSPEQTGKDIIIAKGNIPTPKKYHLAIETYLDFVSTETNNMILELEFLEKKLKTGEVKKAEQAYIQAHQHYEAIRPIVILFGNTDRTINAREDYFLHGVKDYRFMGFHLVEYQLFDRKNIKAALEATDKLLIKSRDLKKRISADNIDIINLVQASVYFIEMILETKLAGKENIYSLSDLNDVAANLRGSKEVVSVLTPFIMKKTLRQILHNFEKSNNILSNYQLSKGRYKPYSQLSTKDKMTLYSILSQQAELLAVLRTQLDVNVYHKY
ncbi:MULTISPECIES: EfeM/EfeO family lipoprotein [Arsenophonus]|jgi:iron uptake system component EfeO|uniref:EfeM/EfeO family lipoprotein n=1 Tax=Arsenophonus apicola TaxID=2879119 RepID=A0ABY8P021_9GAMM|nr:EfeM/EfeO family lipoprotein [Arsenophonus apicola]UBX30904.1 EfeM/EfeO family lipoprotein [Arsenophonus apicola]WGO82239.1 EfeM/EfeO family lipoprotein [Arsenophonus apicola]